MSEQAQDLDQINAFNEERSQRPSPRREPVEKKKNSQRDFEFGTTPDFEAFFGERLDGQAYEIKLYRIDTSKSPTVTKYVGRYQNIIPQEEDIAREHGAKPGQNHYRAACWNTTKKITHTKEIWIDETLHHLYEDAHPVIEARPEVHQSLSAPIQQVDPIQYVSTIMKDIINPVLELTIKNKPAAPPMEVQNQDYYQKTMEGVLSSLTKGLKTMGETIMQNQMDKLTDTIPEGMPEPGTQSFNIAKEIFQVLKLFGEKFLKGEGKPKSELQNMMKEYMGIDPNLVDDQAANMVYNLCVNDKEIGKKKADELFKKAGFQVPDSV